MTMTMMMMMMMMMITAMINNDMQQFGTYLLRAREKQFPLFGIF